MENQLFVNYGIFNSYPKIVSSTVVFIFYFVHVGKVRKGLDYSEEELVTNGRKRIGYLS